MNRISLFVMVLIIASGVMVGCGKKEEAKQTSQPKQEQKKDVKKEEVKHEENKKELGQLFKLSDIKNKSQEEVNKFLGEPKDSRQEKWHYYDTKEEAPNCFVNIYEKNNTEIEIFYIDGKAARLTITPKETISADNINGILKMFYLSYDNPTFSNNFAARWEGQFGVHEFDINFQDEKVTFIYIILDEKYR